MSGYPAPQVIHVGQPVPVQTQPYAHPTGYAAPVAYQAQGGADPLGYQRQYARTAAIPRGKYKAVIRATDMCDEEMIQDCVDMASEALDRFTLEKEMARYVKYELDKRFDPTWHVIVGKSFGSFVAHERGYFCHFFIGPLAFMVFKLR